MFSVLMRNCFVVAVVTVPKARVAPEFRLFPEIIVGLVLLFGSSPPPSI
jgi:hypothetical protein